jgi:small subunit ribosomal protein S27e
VLSEWDKLIPKPRSKFLRVKCSDCGNEQVVFNSTTMQVNCNVCGSVLAESSGGKAKIRGEVVAELE